VPRVFGQLDAEEQRLLLQPLAPILSLRPLHREAYIRTLHVLRTTAHHGKAAKRLHLHANSVRYRIERIEEYTRVNLARVDERQALDLAVILYMFQQGAEREQCTGATS
jgi:DNA-binding PucR family transcriptional regulator